MGRLNLESCIEPLDISDTADEMNTKKELPGSDFGWQQTRQTRVMRATVFLFVLLATIVACFLCFFVLRDQTEESFERLYFEFADALTSTFRINLESKVLAVDQFRITMTSYGESDVNSSWPFVTVPDFHVRASGARSRASALTMEFAPIVPLEDRETWEAYALDNLDWVETGKAYDTLANLDSRELLEVVDGVASEIYVIKDGGKVAASEKKSYFPVWQHSPVNEEIINFDVASIEITEEQIIKTMETSKAILSPTIEIDDGNAIASQIFMPLYSDLKTGIKSDLAGMLLVKFDWESCLQNSLIYDDVGVTAVLSNECGQTYSYRIHGTELSYLGEGDRHESDFNYLMTESPIYNKARLDKKVARYKGISLEESCHYTLRVYPTQAMYDEHHNNIPVITLIILLCICIPMTCAICAYERAVSRRYELLKLKADQANAIVATMFPAAVQERLLNGEEDFDLNENREFIQSPEIQDKIKNSFGDYDADDENGLTVPIKMDNTSHVMGFDVPKAIAADSFAATTILFGDIVGFTAWSSQRDPGEIFTLLQTIYHAFDNTASKIGVFKVETVGDCYVAATGIPEAQADHAVRMARFARAMMSHMNELTRMLEITLGPDTGDLKMRIGMHSGPLTGGVLRGEKARFQLFGDTMNMSARMESTGCSGRIQCSTATAELIKAGGKGHWVQRREDLVQAKGKGEVQTYWIQLGEGYGPNDRDYDISERFITHNKEADAWANTKLVFDLPGKGDRYQRLVDWNVEVLSQLLKQIASNRRDSRKPSRNKNIPSLQQQAGSSARDEVAECITLPSYDPRAEKPKDDPDNVQLDPLVVNQLRDYVTTVASMYHANSFHNFEHASHVTMSTNKLLRRIIEPHLHNLGTEKLSALELHSYTYGITSDPMTQFALLFCALVHDVDHAGVSNFQLIKENATIARLYKNQSVAEQNSVDLAWDLLMDPGYSALQQAIYSDETEMKRFRQLVVNIVLATDIFDKDMKSIRETRWTKAFQYADPGDQYQEESKMPEPALKPRPIAKIDGMNLKATIVLEHLIQASDVAHTMQHWDIYLKWNERLFREMYAAYDAGRAGKNPADNWYEGEIMFFDKYIIPLAKKLDECGVFGVSSDEYLSYANANRRQWAVQGDQVTERFIERYEEMKARKGGFQEEQKEDPAMNV